METTVLTVIIHPIEIMSLIHSFIDSFIHSFIHAFIHPKGNFCLLPFEDCSAGSQRLGIFKTFLARERFYFYKIW